MARKMEVYRKKKKMGMDMKKTNQEETNQYVLATGTLYCTVPVRR
jgi:hypothetical protein